MYQIVGEDSGKTTLGRAADARDFPGLSRSAGIVSKAAIYSMIRESCCPSEHSHYCAVARWSCAQAVASWNSACTRLPCAVVTAVWASASSIWLPRPWV